MQIASWWYDEFKHFGVDFADVDEVREYDVKQGSSVSGERELVKELGISSDDTVLEYGCGTGAFVVAAAQQCHRVIAVDISKAMLDFARERAEKLGLSNIEYCRAGFLTYKHQTDPVNFVVTKFALHHLPDFWKSVALVKIYNTLIKGGRFFLKDVVFSFEPQNHQIPVNNWIINLSASGGSFSKETFEAHIRSEYSTYGFIIILTSLKLSLHCVRGLAWNLVVF